MKSKTTSTFTCSSPLRYFLTTPSSCSTGIMRLHRRCGRGGPPGPEQQLVPIANVLHDLQAGIADQLLDVRRGEIARDEVGSGELVDEPDFPGHFGTDEYRDLRWTMVRVAVYAGVGSRAAARPLPRLQLLPRLRWCVPSRRIEQRAPSLDYCNRARQICGVQPLHGAEGLAGDFFWFEVQQPRTVAWDYARMKSRMNPVSRNGRPTSTPVLQ